uniref:Membrane protein, palmitoylated 4a (MAGUK p55 subfamily member 4) n=2 Tax=Schistosoma mansoni TaxID=6183 RepID=A0A5K4F5Q5_SCHMA
MSLAFGTCAKSGNENVNARFSKTYEQIELLLSQAKPQPISLCAKAAAIEAYDHLRCHHYIPEAEQLVNLLARPHIKSLLLCHDGIANKAYGPVLPQISSEVDEDDISVKVVNLIKNYEPLGVTIKINERNGAVLVARVMHGGAADRTDAIDVGDEIQEINGITVHGRDPMEVIRMLTTISGDVKLKLIPSITKKQQAEKSQVHVRALFSYSPSSDSLTPCPEAGLAFLKGEILRIVNSEDPNWWQAVKVEFPLSGIVPFVLGNNLTQPSLSRAGLIPSKMMREWKMQYHFNSLHTNGGQDTQINDSLSYEEVERYFPEEGCYRPIVLVGPSGVGKSELIRQLIRTDPEHFREPIRITTQEPKSEEVHGVDYLFVTKDEFNTFMDADCLIDPCETSKNCMTGLCLDAVLEIIQAGQVAIFEADYRNLMSLRTSTLKPFIIFVKPPTFDVLLETRQSYNHKSSNCNTPTINDTTSTVELSPTHSVPTTPHLTNRTIGGCFTPVRNSQQWRKVSGELGQEKKNTMSSAPSLSASSSLDNILATEIQKKVSLAETHFHEMIQTASRLEVTHGHLWDFVLINDDLPVALEQLSEMAYRIETEAFWIPRIWLNSTSNELNSENSRSYVDASVSTMNTTAVQ